MTTARLVRHFLTDYRRNGVNLLVLVLVPVAFVVVAADTMADAARLLGGAGDEGAMAAVTAGWSAAFLSGIAMYFQMSAASRTDRRLVLCGLARSRLISARMGAGTVLACVGSTAGLLALALTAGLAQPLRVMTGTLMFALVYVAIGAVVGVAVSNPVNGTVTLLFIWILDVFFGPALSSSTSSLTRVLPTHFVSLWTTDLPTRHTGPSSLQWSLAWTVVALAIAVMVMARLTGVARRPRDRAWGGPMIQLRTGLRMALRDWRRTPMLAVLLVLVPTVFILLADVITPDGHTPVTLREAGSTYTEMVNPAHIHAGTMAPIAVGALAALAGISVVLDSRSADQRLVLAGQRPGVALTTRLGMIGLAAGLATAAALSATAMVFRPHQWPTFILANLLVAITYGLIGVVLGRVFGRVSATFLAFLVPFLDLGIGQSPMLDGEPRAWARYLPGYGSIRVMIDGALTAEFDEGPRTVLAVGWIALLLGLVIALFRRTLRATPPSTRPQRGVRVGRPVPHTVNVKLGERLARVAAGPPLIAFGLWLLPRVSMPSTGIVAVLLVAVGGWLVVTGITGRCPMYRQIGIVSSRARADAAPPATVGVSSDRDRP